MGRPLACCLFDLVAGTCSLCGPVSTVNGKISCYGSYELPHLAVDSVDHSHSKRQQEGHLHMSLLSWFGGFAIDDLGDPVGRLANRPLGWELSHPAGYGRRYPFAEIDSAADPCSMVLCDF
jgi:hypothetical protein